MNWNMRYNGATTFPGLIMWSATNNGPLAVPGDYQVMMTVNGEDQTQSFELIQDPLSTSTQSELQEQFDFLILVRDKLSAANQSVIDIRKIRTQINDVLAKTADDQEQIKELGKAILEEMKSIEEALYQTKNESRQDPLNFPIRLNNKVGHLGSLIGTGTYKPTDQAKDFYNEVAAAIDKQINLLDNVKTTRIDEFNKIVYESKIEAVKIED